MEEKKMTKRLLKVLGWLMILCAVLLLIAIIVGAVGKARENGSEQIGTSGTEITEEIPEVTPEATPETTQEATPEATQEATNEVQFDADSVIRIIPADEAGKVCVYFGNGTHKIYKATDSDWIVVDENDTAFLIDDESFKLVEEESRKAFEDGRLHITFADGQKRSVSY